jgi:alkylation response protein AidB-like acyl-CoA dehydrogenase
MDTSYSAEEQSFRNEVRSWLAGNLPSDIRDKVVGYRHLTKDEFIRWHKILAAKGWSVPHWPVEWGGTGWDITQRYIYDEEFGLAGAPGLPSFGPSMCASVLMRFGTDEQKNRFLPGIRSGDDFWVQGYSEPGSGSDLASLKTRAERKGDREVAAFHRLEWWLATAFQPPGNPVLDTSITGKAVRGCVPSGARVVTPVTSLRARSRPNASARSGSSR